MLSVRARFSARVIVCADTGCPHPSLLQSSGFLSIAFILRLGTDEIGEIGDRRNNLRSREREPKRRAPNHVTQTNSNPHPLNNFHIQIDPRRPTPHYPQAEDHSYVK